MKLVKLFLFTTIIHIALLSINPINYYYTVQAEWLDNLKDGVCKIFNSPVTEEWEGDDPEIEKLMQRDKDYYVDQAGKNSIPYRPKKTTTDLNCAPPWHRYTGRTGCLLKYPVNGLGPTLSRLIYCPEAIDDTSNDPKMRVRAQLCNTAFCRVSDDVLTHGKCSLFAGSWEVNPVRLCARIAYPNMIHVLTDAKDNISEDPSCKRDRNDEPGYTRCIHVDEHGRQRADWLIEVQDKNTKEKKKKRILAPKLCLYNDPWLYNPKLLLALTGGILTAFTAIDDPFDWDPNYQPEHQYQYKFIKSPTYIQALIEQKGKNLSEEEIAKLVINKSEVKKVNLDVGPVFSFLTSIINQVSKLVNNVKTHYNNVVEPEILGCVELPLGVSPPPFYDTLDDSNYTPEIQVQQICSLSQIKSKSTITNNDTNSACVMSDSRNNVIHNSVRVMENNLLHLCPDDNSKKTQEKFNAGECVKIHLPYNALKIHENLRDNIALCNESASNTPCIMHKNPSLVTKNFRILYTTVASSDQQGYSTSPQNFNYCIPLCTPDKQCPAQTSKLLDNKTDCCNKFKGVCQRVWGINAGSYTDAVLDFNTPAGQSNNDKVLFNKFDFQGKKLMALITRQHIDIQPEFLQNPNAAPSKKVVNILHRQKPEEICVYDITNKYKLIGCVPRAERPIPSVKACKGGSGNHFKPKIGIQLAVKKNNTSDDLDILEGCVEAQNIHHNTRTSINANLAGYDYSAYVTDEYDSIIDDTNYDTNKGDILGNHYKTDDTQKVHDSIYLGGLEKKYYAYVSGGKLICLDSNHIGNSCSPMGSELQKSLCVLSKKIKNSLSHSIENREDPKFDKNQCTSASKDYPKCLKLDESHYYKLPEEKSADEIKDIVARIRTKNSLELGLCIKIPEMPNCKGLTDKYTIWSDAKVGEKSVGKCKSSDSQYDYIASPNEQALRRLCYFDPATPNGDIYFTSGDSATPVLGTPEGECKQVAHKCKEEEVNGVIWPETEVGKSAIPRCANSDYELTGNNNTERRCILDLTDNEYKFEEIPATVECRMQAKPSPVDEYIESIGGRKGEEIKLGTGILYVQMGLGDGWDNDGRLYRKSIDGSKVIEVEVISDPYDDMEEVECLLLYIEVGEHINENLAIQFGFVYGNNEFTSIRSAISDKNSYTHKQEIKERSIFLKAGQEKDFWLNLLDGSKVYLQRVLIKLKDKLEKGDKFFIRPVQQDR